MLSPLHPIRYKIDITPNFDNFQFKGRVEILIRADSAATTVVLNAMDLAVWRVEIRTNDDWRPCVFTQDPLKETLTILWDQAVQGDFSLRIDYEGDINDQMEGFYRSRYKKDGRVHYIAVTQFQESSARKALPCMDHPLKKAVFEVSLTIPQNLEAISNTHVSQVIGPDTDEARLKTGTKRVVFAPTPRMSTYLLFFGAGAFESIQDQQDSRVRVHHLPGLAHTTDLGVDFGRKALRYCEQYYAIPYPLQKMDLIAVPDFAFGAMENWGAITFRENLLLRFPGITSKAGVQRICEIIAHEIAHQWFGNLVTPSDWKYLWLNESFATFFGYGVVDHYYPEYSIWDQFLNNETGTAMARDGLDKTPAIEIPGGEHVVINTSTAPIIYNKGASIMRMIKAHIGDDNYKNGVRAYLNNHQYDCAESRHLWEAFESVSRQPVTAMMQSWINQPGHPVVGVKRNNDRLELEQKRFTYLDQAYDQLWMIPLTLSCWDQAGRQKTETRLMRSATDTIELPPATAAYTLNAGRSGFFRTDYHDQDNLAALGGLIAAQKLPATDRWGIQDDLYALARQGRLPFSDYLAYLRHYATESAYLPLVSICDHLHQALVIAPDDRKEEIRTVGAALAEKALDRMGFTPAADEAQTTSLTRDQLLWQAVLWGSAKAAVFAQEQFSFLIAGKQVHADIVKAVMQAGAYLQGQPALDWLFSRFDQTPSEHERLNILTALGAFRDWALTARALSFTLDKVPPRNRFIPIVAAGLNPENQPHLWRWYLDNLQTLEALHPLLYERVITGLWPYGGLDNDQAVGRFAQDYLRKRPSFRDAADLALENLMINTRMRRAMTY